MKLTVLASSIREINSRLDYYASLTYDFDDE